MISEKFISLGIGLLDVIYSMLGVLPDMPAPVVNAVDKMFAIMFDAVGLVGIFVDMSLVKILIPLAIAIINFDKILKLVIFVIRKIPFLSMK
jgi:hypothetical protein